MSNPLETIAEIESRLSALRRHFTHAKQTGSLNSLSQCAHGADRIVESTEMLVGEIVEHIFAIQHQPNQKP